MTTTTESNLHHLATVLRPRHSVLDADLDLSLRSMRAPSVVGASGTPVPPTADSAPGAADAGPGHGAIGTVFPPSEASGTSRIPDDATAGLRDFSHDIQLRKTFARGGQGEIWEAVQVSLGRTIAAKAVLGESEDHEDFFKEAFTAAQLDHPNILPVYDLGFASVRGQATPMLAMKKIEGDTWHNLLWYGRRREPFVQEEFLAENLGILVQITNAISYAHSKGVIHRDLKPGQVMVGRFGEVYLLDWGLAMFVGDEAPVRGDGDIDVSRLANRRTGVNPAGTPAYMAPEQIETTTQRLSLATDIYLLGAILYEILTGKPPHQGATLEETLASVRDNRFDPLPPGTPAELGDLVHLALSSRPEDRPPTAEAFRRALQDYLSGARRRAQSAAITARFVVPDVLDDYRELSAKAATLGEAATLWPENPGLAACRRALLATYVQTAIRRRDFLLARLQADRLADPHLTPRLHARIDVAQEEALAELPSPPLLTPMRVMTIVAVWVILIGVMLTMESAASRTVTDEAHKRLRAIASGAAQGIESRDLSEVDETRGIYNVGFQLVFRRLSLFRELNPDICSIYVARPEVSPASPQWRILVDADPVDLDMNGDGTIQPAERGRPPGTILRVESEKTRSALMQRQTTSAIIEGRQGRSIAAYAPVVDSSTREMVAILGIESSVDRVAERLRAMRLAMLIGGFVVLVVVTVALLILYGNLKNLARVRQLEELLRRQNRDLGTGTLSLG